MRSDRKWCGPVVGMVAMLVLAGGGVNARAGGQTPSLDPPAASETPSSRRDAIRAFLKEAKARGLLPDLDRGPGIEGPDLDGNGIRDDIDAVIAKMFVEPEARVATSQYARALQASLLVDFKNVEAVRRARDVRARGRHCMDLRIEGLDEYGVLRSEAAQDRLHSFTMNTRERFSADVKFNEALAGSSWGLQQGNTCDE